ncbi:RNA polymerase sigma factor [Paracoccus aerodenitrificans]|uniref:RNA polymerase sigma factor n=1 Tax=Paracoccus aerodenitrificans TaxID=3017781 RepID=UPI0022F0ACD8|nr:RNA polymerase sigma factor [Paracoccus aerodenitrificans]WBU65369.1 RNA polymerase sigma factor [Paracoccus aerodenitrificans]
MTWTLDSLFQRYADEIRRGFVRRGHSVEDAVDLTQEVFLRLIRVGMDEKLANPGAYLHQIARNLSVDSRRKAHHKYLVDLPAGLVESVADPQPAEDAKFLYREQIHIVEDVLAGLPDKTRQAFILYQFKGMTMSETAKTIGLSASRTWVLIHQAYDVLRRALDDGDMMSERRKL